MFSKIRELIEDSNALVFVLIDEVESLTRARESSMSGTEPSDMIRAVNSVLTEIDQIRKYERTEFSDLNYLNKIESHNFTMSQLPQY